jgi:hypothetical protein
MYINIIICKAAEEINKKYIFLIVVKNEESLEDKKIGFPLHKLLRVRNNI